jgi:hypothetical protein
MSEIEILVETAESFEDYEEAWLACMSHVHWIEDRGPFDYHSEEELEERYRKSSTNLRMPS